MSKSDSKIPLILTVLVLGYVVYRAVGYVNDYKQTTAAQQPVIQAEAKEPNAPSGLVAGGPSSRNPAETAGRASQNAYSVPDPASDGFAPAVRTYAGPDKSQNKKLWGSVQGN